MREARVRSRIPVSQARRSWLAKLSKIAEKLNGSDPANEEETAPFSFVGNGNRVLVLVATP